MKTRNTIRTARRSRSGLTLIELIVVLVVLTALAGILLPRLPEMLTRTHVATHATNVSEIQKWLETYALTNFAYPDGMDSLIEGTAVFAGLPNAVGVIDPLTLDVDLAGALNEAGIDFVYENEIGEASGSATFAPYDGDPVVPVVIPVADAEIIAQVADTVVNGIYPGRPLGATYAIFGVGELNEAIGESMSAAPVHFPENLEVDNPEISYQRFLVIFQLTDELGSALETAELVGVVASEEGGAELSALEGVTAEFYELNG